ncbi:NRDE family protein [Microbulbifer zhoushanensis]|uniref:NRDE family protein n=1 Tax=Microbulbifer zhoushanensis TaxID=2904254 RepID=UPI001F2A01A7|nr:NRDE family protein [Microbulbifer zhoushanensis]
MCLLLFAYRTHPHYPLLLAANRDEFFARPTAAADHWGDSGVVAGRDLEAGGTWAGAAAGRVAAVTNIREPQVPSPTAPLSRGDIPRDFLLGPDKPREFAAQLAAERYRGYNALLFQLGEQPELVCAGNRHPAFAFAPGVHGISNGAPDAPWPKVVRGRAQLAQLVAGLGTGLGQDNFVTPALALLGDRQPASVQELPDTGVGRALERALSPMFVHIERGELAVPRDGDKTPPDVYGTRASTLVAVDRDGVTQFWEQTFTETGQSGPLRHFTLSPH